MQPDRMISISREVLSALADRAGREAPRTSEEVRAVEDARDLLARDFQAAFPAEPDQLSLFDASAYDRG